tara:strand:+ start:6293 stop:6490 length:198 start_codon:yes stop_codon:yes gene_type:complete
MEEKAKEILWKVAIAETHPDKAYKELCFLFGVSKSFYCYDKDIQKIDNYGELINRCKKQCKTCKQ